MFLALGSVPRPTVSVLPRDDLLQKPLEAEVDVPTAEIGGDPAPENDLRPIASGRFGVGR